MHILLTQTFCLMCNTQGLWLSNNTIGDAGVEALSKACVGGALASLEKLYLSNTQIGDAGMQAFSTALAGGAMAQLQARSLPTALSLIPETLHVHSPDSDDLYGVQYADT